LVLFGNHQPIFVDPAEVAVTVSGNAVKLIAADGAATTQTGPAGQVYAATVNGVAMTPSVPTQTYNGLPYWPLNLNNLDIAGPAITPPTPTPDPPPTPTPAPTPTPSPTPIPMPTPAPPDGSAPPVPRNLSAVAVGPSQIDLTWDPSPGATGYMVERRYGGGMWVVIARGVLSPSYADTGLADSTTYQYAVMATSGDGYSEASAPAAARTGLLTDALAIQPLVITTTRRQLFSGIVATFADANATAAAGRFVATIRWGDGRVSRGTVTGSNGQFAVVGRHRYAVAGRYAVEVDVTMSAPSRASTSTTSTAAVGGPLRVTKRAARARHALARRIHRS
jgi:hypothetical protein